MYVSPPKASFKKSMRGYQARQVDAYLKTLCTEFADAEEDYQSRIVMLEKEIAALREQLALCGALQQENALLRQQLEALQHRRIVIGLRKKKSSSDITPPKTAQKDHRRAESATDNAERLRKVFGVGAKVIRIVGHTGRKAMTIVNALPSTVYANTVKAPAAPTTAAQAKQLVRTLTQEERAQKAGERRAQKQRKQQLRAIKAAKKMQKKIEKAAKA